MGSLQSSFADLSDRISCAEYSSTQAVERAANFSLDVNLV